MLCQSFPLHATYISLVSHFFCTLLSSSQVQYSCPQKRWSECDQSNIEVTVIDSSNGPFFSVSVADLNADRKLDLLVTNNNGNGSVFAYETPDKTGGNWTSHVLSSGYKPKGL